MIYLYAYTNHKDGLDSLRRVKVIYDALKEQGIEASLVLNEFRAQLLAKEWGLPKGLTVENVNEMIHIAKRGDVIIVDTNEEFLEILLDFAKDTAIIYLNSSCKEKSYPNIITVDLFKDGALYPKIAQSTTQNEHTALVFKDSDYEKILLQYLDSIDTKKMDLYWGIYFFVKYEEKLKKYFNSIIESENYYEILQNYNFFVTASQQIAIEAKANNKAVIFLNLKKENNQCIDFIRNIGIKVVNDFSDISFDNKETKENINVNNKLVKIIDIINKNM